MDIQILSKNDSEIVFRIDKITATFANSLRRTMVSEIPTMAIEWIDFRKNDSVVADELLANRLGQVPLTFDKKLYNLPDECKCEGKGCSRCQVKIILKKKDPAVVYSGDLKIRNKDVKPVFDKIILVKLFEGDELEFEATAQLGLGKEHSKWQAALVGYKNVPNIILDVKNQKDFEKFMKICPRHLFKIDKNKLVVTNPLDCNLCMQCVEASKNEEVKVSAVEDSFVFKVETVSGLSPEDIVATSADILEKKMKDFGSALKKLK